MSTEETPQSAPDSSGDVHERLWLPLLIPMVIFAFAVLIIYGLSRIYLELNEISVGEVTMATPLAIVVTLYILFAAWYLANNRRVPMWQTASIAMVAVAFLTAGAIWAAVDDRDDHGEPTTNGGETPAPPGEEGQILVGLVDPEWAVTASPSTAAAGDLTFVVENQGSLVHNLRVAQTDLADDQLPLDATGIQVDEANLNIVASVPDFNAPEIMEVDATLEAGNYVLFCNIAGHYDSGMHTTLTVE